MIAKKTQQIGHGQCQKIENPQWVAISLRDRNEASDRECEKHDREDTARWRPPFHLLLPFLFKGPFAA
jgi:hypothetical protein